MIAPLRLIELIRYHEISPARLATSRRKIGSALPKSKMSGRQKTAGPALDLIVRQQPDPKRAETAGAMRKRRRPRGDCNGDRMSVGGQNPKYPPRADVFRFGPNNGHRSIRVGMPVGGIDGQSLWCVGRQFANNFRGIWRSMRPSLSICRPQSQNLIGNSNGVATIQRFCRLSRAPWGWPCPPCGSIGIITTWPWRTPRSAMTWSAKAFTSEPRPFSTVTSRQQS